MAGVSNFAKEYDCPKCEKFIDISKIRMNLERKAQNAMNVQPANIDLVKLNDV
jgi:hypothetical protein